MTFEKLKRISATSGAFIRSMPVFTASRHAAFRDDASRGAIFAADGEIELPITTIDEVLGGRRLTVRQDEHQATRPRCARWWLQRVRKWQPRLALSVSTVPAIYGAFRGACSRSTRLELYVRQHDGGIIETVSSALPNRSRIIATSGETMPDFRRPRGLIEFGLEVVSR